MASPEKQRRVTIRILVVMAVIIGFPILSKFMPLPDWVTDTGVKSGYQGLTWMDNDRIMFVKMKDAAPGERKDLMEMAIWNMKDGKGKLELYPTDHLPGSGTICYAEGRLVYPKFPKVYGGETHFARQGGQETSMRPYDINGFSIAFREYFERQPFNPHTCRNEVTPDTMKDKALWVRPLRRGDGYLAMPTTEDFVYWYADRTAKGIPLSIPQNTDTHIAKYHPYRDAYYLGPRNPSVANHCYDIWWFSLGKKPEHQCVPEDTDFRILEPTKTGMFIVNGEGGGMPNKNWNGGYFYRDERIIELLKGVIRSAEVSPDGCRVAVLHETQGYRYFGVIGPGNAPPTLKIIDVCSDIEAFDDLSSITFY